MCNYEALISVFEKPIHPAKKGSAMFEAISMTDQARSMIDDAGLAALQLQDPFVSSEHLLLVLSASANTVARRLLDHFGLSHELVDRNVGLYRQATGYLPLSGGLPISDGKYDMMFTKAIDLAWNEATYFGGPRGTRGVVDTEHLLIGLSLDPKGFAGNFLPTNGADYVNLRSVLAKFGAQEGAVPA